MEGNGRLPFRVVRLLPPLPAPIPEPVAHKLDTLSASRPTFPFPRSLVPLLHSIRMRTKTSEKRPSALEPIPGGPGEPMSPRTQPVRISIDLGSNRTRLMRQDSTEEPLTIPTAFLRNSDRNSFVVGKVLLSQNSKDAVWPMRGGVVGSEEDCLLFLRILRKWFVPDAEEVWAIMSAPSSGRAGEAERLAQLAGLVFERALVVPGLTLSALTLMNEWKRELKASTLLDLGASSIQAALVSGAWPEPNEIVHFEGGGNIFDLRLVAGINELFPGLSGRVISYTVYDPSRYEQEFGLKPFVFGASPALNQRRFSPQTSVPNLFCVGDSVLPERPSVPQAMESGILGAQKVLKRMKMTGDRRASCQE